MATSGALTMGAKRGAADAARLEMVKHAPDMSAGLSLPSGQLASVSGFGGNLEHALCRHPS